MISILLLLLLLPIVKPINIMLAAAEVIAAENLRGRGHCDGGSPPYPKTMSRTGSAAVAGYNTSLIYYYDRRRRYL